MKRILTSLTIVLLALIMVSCGGNAPVAESANPKGKELACTWELKENGH